MAGPVVALVLLLLLIALGANAGSTGTSTATEKWTINTASFNDSHFALALSPTGTVLTPEGVLSLVFSTFTVQPLDLEAPDIAPPPSASSKGSMTTINDTSSRLASIAALVAAQRDMLVLSVHPNVAIKTTSSSSTASNTTTSTPPFSAPMGIVSSSTLPTWGAVPDALIPLLTTQIIVNATAASPSWPGVAVLLPYCRSTLHPRCLASGYTYALNAAAAGGARARDALQLNTTTTTTAGNTTTTSNGTLLLPLEPDNTEGEVHFMTPEPHVPVVAFDVAALADTGATCILRLNRSDILPVPRLFHGGRGNGDAALKPSLLVQPAPASAAHVDVRQAVDAAGNDILDTFVIAIDALWPFTHYRLSLALCTPQRTYATQAVVFTTHIGTPTTPLRSMRLPDRSLEPTAFLVRTASPKPATGYVHYIQAEVLDTISGQTMRTRHDYGVNLGQCKGLGDAEAVYSWFINGLLPNTPYSVRARAILLPQWRSELVRIYGTFGLALPQPASTSTAPQLPPVGNTTSPPAAADSEGGDGDGDDENDLELLAAPWTPWVSTVTLQARQPKLTIRTRVLNATHFAVEWEKQRQFAPFVRHNITVFANVNDTITVLSITDPATTRVVLDHRRFQPAGASHIAVVAINALGSSPSSSRVAVPVYVDPTAEIDDSGLAMSEAALGTIVAFAILIPIVAFFIVRRYQKRMHFQFPEKDEWELDRSAIASGREVGRGEFGIVRKGVYNEKVVAIKTLRPGTGLAQARAFIEEATVMKKLSANGGHPNIVQLHGVMMQEHPLGVVLEYLANGSLRSLLLDTRKRHPEFLDLHQLLLFALDISQGMCYMTRRGVIHRDLAARNCLVTGDWTVKIADFGFARAPVLEHNYHATYTKQGNVVLPMRWVAPEVFTDGRFCELSDVWSFGVTLWEIFSHGELPYAEVPPQKIVTEVLSGRRLPQPEHCPRLLFLLMQRCWERDRPSFSAIRTFLLTAFTKYNLGAPEGERVHPELRLARAVRDDHRNDTGSDGRRHDGIEIANGVQHKVEAEQTLSQPVSGFNESRGPSIRSSGEYDPCGCVEEVDDGGDGDNRGGGCELMDSGSTVKGHTSGCGSRSRIDSSGSGRSEHDAQLDAVLMRGDDEDESTLTRLLSPGDLTVLCEHNRHQQHGHLQHGHLQQQQHPSSLGDDGEVLRIEHELQDEHQKGEQQLGRRRSASAADSGHIHSDVDPSPPVSNPASAYGRAATSALAIAELKADARTRQALTAAVQANGAGVPVERDAEFGGGGGVLWSGSSMFQQQQQRPQPQPYLSLSLSPYKRPRDQKPLFCVESSVV